MRINRSIIANQTESVPVLRTLTINGTTYDLTENRSWTVSGGGLSGSGTTNYLSKWTSGSALGNSLVFDNGTNVGINTATPSYKLDVLGIISASVDATYNGENGAIIAGNATTPNKRLFIGYDGTNDVGFIQSLHSGVGYKNLVLNPTLGFVGIGTITPSHLLEVNGDALVNGTFTITASTALPVQTAANLRFASGFSSPDIGRMYIGDGTGWKFHMSKRISSVTTDLITFVDNGSVVIGTPGAFIDYKLEVMGSTKVNGGELLVDAGSTIASNLYGTGQVLSGSSAQPTLFLDTTWNTTGNPSAIELNVTNTASGSASKVMNLKVDSTSVFTVSKGGAIQTTEPTGYTAKPWKLGDVYTGTISEDRYILVEIDGNIYSIAAMAGTP